MDLDFKSVTRDELLTAALETFKRRLQELDAKLWMIRRQILRVSTEPKVITLKRPKMSLKGRRAVSEAQKRRWDKFRAEKAS